MMRTTKDTAPDRGGRVLAHPIDGPDGNPYTPLLYGNLRELGWEAQPFLPRRTLTRRADVVHIHWPQALVLSRRGRPSWTSLLKSVAGLSWARRRGAALVWTVHNLDPHEPTPQSRLLRRYLVRNVDGWLTLSESAHGAMTARFPALTRTPSRVVPHGHYRDAYAPVPSKERARSELGISSSRVLLAFGAIRPYKGITALARAFEQMPGDVTLLVAGRPDDPDEVARVFASARRDRRILTRLGVVPARDVPTIVGAADVVVAAYQEVTHSGVALLSLSMDRPVLCADAPAMRELQRLVGSDWVRVLDGHLTPEALDVALRALPTGSPDLGTLDWSRIAEETSVLYTEAVEARRGTGATTR